MDRVERALRALERHEEASVRELARLLRAARRDIRVRLAQVEPGGPVAQVRQQLLSGLEVAVLDLNRRMDAALQQQLNRAASLGAAAVEAGLPASVAGGFGFTPQFLEAIRLFSASQVVGVTGPLRDAITREVQVGLLAGEDAGAVSRRIMGTGVQPIGPFHTAQQRATAIARTEINRVANLAIQQRLEAAAAEIPGLKKQWLAARDGRTRPSHRGANGQTVPVTGLYVVGGYKCKHPGDPRLPAREVVRCRCRSVPVVPEPDAEPAARR